MLRSVWCTACGGFIKLYSYKNGLIFRSCYSLHVPFAYICKMLALIDMADNELVRYSMGQGVEAFSTMRGAVLPRIVLPLHQVHGIQIGVVDAQHCSSEDFNGYDALVTNQSITIGVKTADCIPILLYDPVHKAVAAIHSGWRGTVQKIVHHAISKMSLNYGTAAQDLIAVIGPGIGFDSFQVGEEVTQAFADAGFPLDKCWRWDGPPLLQAAQGPGSMQGGHHIDLKAANKWLLMGVGVPEENIQVSDIDTYTDARFFSARREGRHCGRIITSIRLL